MKMQPPRCLQRRAPASFEILDRRGRRVKSTMTGYRLHPNAEYDLVIWTQDGSSSGWDLQPQRSRSFFQWEFGGGPSRTGRTQPFRTTGVLRSHLFFLDSPMDEMALTLNFQDGRQPYEMKIPVCLANRWIYAPAVFIALASLFSSYKLLGLNFMEALLLTAGIIVLFTGVCYVLDLLRSWFRAKREVQRYDDELARCQTDRPVIAAAE